MMNKLQRVVTGIQKFDCSFSQILHNELHWLDIPDQVFFKLAVTVHRCLNGRAPAPYLSDYCVPIASGDIGDICVLPTINCLQYHTSSSTLTAVEPFQLPDPQSGTLSKISSVTRQSVQTASGAYLKRICLLGTAFSALQVIDDK